MQRGGSSLAVLTTSSMELRVLGMSCYKCGKQDQFAVKLPRKEAGFM